MYEVRVFTSMTKGRLLDILSLMSLMSTIDDAHEAQKGKAQCRNVIGIEIPTGQNQDHWIRKHQINDRDRLQRMKGELNNVLFPIPQLVRTVRSYRFKDR
jgi:hypothetical protein